MNVKCQLHRQGYDWEPNFLVDWGCLYILVHHWILPQACRFGINTVFGFIFVPVFVIHNNHIVALFFICTVCYLPLIYDLCVCLILVFAAWASHKFILSNPFSSLLLQAPLKSWSSWRGLSISLTFWQSYHTTSPWPLQKRSGKRSKVFNILKLHLILSLNISAGESFPSGSDRATNWEGDDDANDDSGRGGNKFRRNVENHSSKNLSQKSTSSISKAIRRFELIQSFSGLSNCAHHEDLQVSSVINRTSGTYHTPSYLVILICNFTCFSNLFDFVAFLRLER